MYLLPIRHVRNDRNILSERIFKYSSHIFFRGNELGILEL